MPISEVYKQIQLAKAESNFLNDLLQDLATRSGFQLIDTTDIRKNASMLNVEIDSLKKKYYRLTSNSWLDFFMRLRSNLFDKRDLDAICTSVTIARQKINELLITLSTKSKQILLLEIPTVLAKRKKSIMLALSEGGDLNALVDRILNENRVSDYPKNIETDYRIITKDIKELREHLHKIPTTMEDAINTISEFISTYTTLQKTTDNKLAELVWDDNTNEAKVKLQIFADITDYESALEKQKKKISAVFKFIFPVYDSIELTVANVIENIQQLRYAATIPAYKYKNDRDEALSKASSDSEGRIEDVSENELERLRQGKATHFNRNR